MADTRTPPEPSAATAEFLPDAVELETRRPPWLTRATLYALLALIVIALAWASLSTIDIIVTSQGRLITSAQPVVVQALETSVLRSVDVRIGQAVKKGETVATLDPTFATADVSQVKQRITSLDAEIGRLESELSAKPYAPVGAAEDDRIQADLHERRTSEYEARVKGLQADIARLEADLSGTQRTQKVLAERLEGLKKIEVMKKDLNAKKFVSELDLLEAKNRRLEVEQGLEDAANKASQLVQQIEQTRQSLAVLTRSWRQKILDDLLKARRDRDALQENLSKAERRSALVQLSAPIDAVVLDINKRSVGTVAKEADVILTLVPQGVPLEAEVQIAAEDIGFVRKDDPARIKIDAFPFQKHGTLEGRLTVIGGDSFPVEPGSAAAARTGTRAYYLARITDIRGDLKLVPGDTRLTPGMTVSAEVKVSERSVISYFLYPLMKAFGESIREP
jgi:HlyD family secretion protein